MSIKTKLTLGVGLLFLLILLLALIGARQVHKLSEDTTNILAANYNTLDYTRQMLDALDELKTESGAAAIFQENLQKQQNNITEKGEKEVTEILANHFEKLMKTPSDTSLPILIRQRLNEIMLLNMDALERKSLLAKNTADNAVIWISLAGTLCFIIAFILLVNLPGNIANPIQELTEKIKEIAARNYNQRVNFESSGEFGELAKAFNIMASKLEEYESSILSKILFEKKRIETLINNMPEPIIGLDEKRKVLFANQEALKILNLRQEELVGQQAWDVASTNDLLRSLIGNLVNPPQLPLSTGKTEPLKIYANNQESYFEKEIIPVNLAPTGSREARHIGDVIILKNITEFKALDTAKTNLINAISHELRTPVTSILSTLRYLEDAPLESSLANQKERIASLREEGERLLKITDTLMSLSQVESGNISLTFNQLNLAEVMKYALETVEIQAAQKQVGIVVKIGENLPPILTDTDKTAWVLVNFLVNAIRYSPEKNTINVEVKKENGAVRFSVQDFGKGIEAKYKDRVFERYFRVPGNDKQGIGLALAISKEFVTAQGGEIGVDSEYGSGSTFWFRLKC